MVPHLGHTAAGVVIAVMADFVRAELVCLVVVLVVVEPVVATATSSGVPAASEMQPVVHKTRKEL